MLMAIGGLLLFIGGILAFIGSIWMLVIMFQDSVVWGLLGLFLGLPILIYAFMHFDKMKKPFFIWLGGFLVSVLGIVLFLGSFANAVATNPDLKKAFEDEMKKQEAIMKKGLTPKGK
jgi:hypothetical protein